MTDPIADMLIRIKNAAAVQKETVLVPHSRLKAQLADLLLKEGFLKGVEKKKKGVQHYLFLDLKYDERGLSFIRGAKRVSKPGRRLYLGHQAIRPLKYGSGRAVISTSKGLMTDQQARKEKMGGELICAIW